MEVGIRKWGGRGKESARKEGVGMSKHGAQGLGGAVKGGKGRGAVYSWRGLMADMRVGGGTARGGEQSVFL